MAADDLDLEEGARLVEKMTAAPWEIGYCADEPSVAIVSDEDGGHYACSPRHESELDDPPDELTDDPAYEAAVADAEGIAWLRNNAARLIAQASALRDGKERMARLERENEVRHGNAGW